MQFVRFQWISGWPSSFTISTDYRNVPTTQCPGAAMHITQLEKSIIGRRTALPRTA